MAKQRDIGSEIDAILESLGKKSKPGEDTSMLVIEAAMKVEELAKNYYATLAGSMKNKAGKAVMESLAGEELNHLRALDAQKAMLKKGEDWLFKERIAPVQAVCPALPSGQVKSGRGIFARILKKRATDADALKLAMMVKMRTIKFYCAASWRIRDAGGRKMLAHLVDLEEKHLRELEAQYGWLEQTGFWYDPEMASD